MGHYNQKVKLLKLYEYLRKETDENHGITRTELSEKLNGMGVSSNPRTVSEDIRELNRNGYEVMYYRVNKEKYYYIAERELSTPELRILIDALQAASFIPKKKTDELIEKVAALGGARQAETLKKNTACVNTRKHRNESILYTIDGIEDAIVRKKKVAYRYFHLDENAERVYRTDDSGEKKRYCVDPVALVFNGDNYYLMAYSSRHPESTACYRIERMDRLEVLEDSVMSEEAAAFVSRVPAYTEEAFRMYGGEKERVVLRFDRPLTEYLFDKFGEDTPVRRVSGTACEAGVSVRVSPMFFGWMAQFGGGMRVLAPGKVVQAYLTHIRAIETANSGQETADAGPASPDVF